MKSFKEYLLEVKKKKGTVVGQQYGPPDNLISVDDIIRKVGNQKRSNTQNVSKLISINKDLENDEGILHKLLKEPSKDFINRTNRANMSFPILVTTKGDIVDGSHRLAKAHFSNQKKIKTITVPDSILRNDKNLKEDLIETAAWTRKEGKNPEGGLNQAGVKSYNREHPKSNLQMAVTTPPSKLKPGSKAAKRRKSFCARMGGMRGPMKDENGKPTRKALSLRKWNC